MSDASEKVLQFCRILFRFPVEALDVVALLLAPSNSYKTRWPLYFSSFGTVPFVHFNRIKEEGKEDKVNPREERKEKSHGVNTFTVTAADGFVRFNITYTRSFSMLFVFTASSSHLGALFIFTLLFLTPYVPSSLVLSQWKHNHHRKKYIIIISHH